MKELTREELSNIYHLNSNEKASKILGMSVPVMLRILKKHKIKMKGSGRRHKDKIKIID